MKNPLCVLTQQGDIKLAEITGNHIWCYIHDMCNVYYKYIVTCVFLLKVQHARSCEQNPRELHGEDWVELLSAGWGGAQIARNVGAGVWGVTDLWEISSSQQTPCNNSYFPIFPLLICFALSYKFPQIQGAPWRILRGKGRILKICYNIKMNICILKCTLLSYSKAECVMENSQNKIKTPIDEESWWGCCTNGGKISWRWTGK